MSHYHVFSITTKSFASLFRHGFFIALCLIAIFFYKERTLHFDPAFFNWLLYLNEEFFFALGRSGAVLGQALPLLFIKMGCSIKTALILFSFSFALIYYVFFLLTEYVTKDKIASWVLVLALSLTFRQTFFYTTAEAYHGMGLCIVLWSLLRWSYTLSPSKNLVVYLVVVITSLWIPYFNQIDSLLWIFLLGLEYVSKRNFRDAKTLILISIAAVWFVLRIKVFELSEYEEGKLLTMQDHMYALKNFFMLPSYLYLKEWAASQMTIPLLFFASCLVFLILGGKYMISLYLAMASVGFVIAIVHTNFRGESPIMYENYYSLFGLFIAAAWAEANRGIKTSLLITLLLCGITIYSTLKIVQSVWIYEQRMSYIMRLTNYAAQSPNDKFIINAKNYPFAYATVAWALTFETALFSEIDDNPAASTYYLTDNPGKWGDIENIPQFLNAPFAENWFGLEHVQSKGLHFSNLPYKLANTARSRPFSEEEFNEYKGNFSIIPQHAKIEITNSWYVANVYILNESGQSLHSLPEGPNQTRIGYQIHQNGVVVAEHLMPLEIDIPTGKSFVSGVVIYKPIDLSVGEIVFGMHTEGFGWWGESSRIRIEVE